MRQGRSDRRGAFRLAAVYVGAGAGASLLRGSGDATQWFAMFQRNVAFELYLGLLVWLFYLAVEPYVRRLWPGTLIAWSRALEGRFRDPMVGRHILLGALSGLGFSILFMLPDLAARAGVASPAPPDNLGALGSTASYLQTFLFIVQDSFMVPVSALMGVLVFRVVFRRPWLAYLVLVTVMGALSLTIPGGLVMSARLFGTVVLVLLILTRLGLFAFLIAVLFSSWDGLGPTIHSSSWFFPQSVVTIAIFALVAVFGFWVSLGDQKLFKDSILER